MERPKCAVKNCENGAMVAYSNKWICGDCMMKIYNKEQEQKQRMLEDLE